MCGIFTLISSTNSINDVQKQHSLRMIKKLNHRGPDTIGYYQNNNVSMAHARLSIIDPTSGTQPLTNDENTLILCVNGEIFNYKELKNIYSPSYSFKTGSDCETILALYSYYSNVCKNNNFILEHNNIVNILGHLDGQFSFILYDKRNDYMFISRDPYGITQSYYGITSNGDIEIASEMKALENCVSVEVIPSGSYIYFNTKDTKNTILQPIHYFADTLNGSWLNKSKLELYDYTPQQTILNETEQIQLMDTIRTTFEKAVSKRLMSDVPFAFLLSGGLDSSLVVSVAVKYIRENPHIYGSNPEIHTFSVGTVGSPDLPKARIVADFLKTIHHEIFFTMDEIINSLEEVIYYLETPDITTIRSSSAMMYMMRKIKSLGFKMVFSGEGHDEWGAGYLYFHQAPDDKEHQLECKKRVLELGYFDCLRCDKSCLSFSIEGRFPFLDHELVKLMINLNKDVKTQKNIEKYIFRKAFDINSNDGSPVYLPHSILWRQKSQFSDAVGCSLIDTLKEYTKTQVIQNSILAYNNRHLLYPINTPDSYEGFYYRQIFEKLYPKRANTFKLWIPNQSWNGITSTDPSGRVQITNRDE